MTYDRCNEEPCRPVWQLWIVFEYFLIIMLLVGQSLLFFVDSKKNMKCFQTRPFSPLWVFRLVSLFPVSSYLPSSYFAILRSLRCFKTTRAECECTLFVIIIVISPAWQSVCRSTAKQLNLLVCSPRLVPPSLLLQEGKTQPAGPLEFPLWWHLTCPFYARLLVCHCGWRGQPHQLFGDLQPSGWKVY